MFKPEKLWVGFIILASVLITLLMVSTVLDLGLIPGAKLRETKPEETAEPFPQSEVGRVEQLQEGWQRFRSAGYAFQIEFPQQISKKSILDQKALNSGLDKQPDAPVWEFNLKNPDYFQGTNLLEASLVVHVLRGEEAVENCSQFKSRSKALSDPDAPESPPTVDINGIPFWKDTVEEGVMGEMYTLISYRTVHQDACYELTQLIKTRNLAFYEPGTVESYDREGVVETLDSVLHTFQFLDVNPTFPKVIYPQPKSIVQPVQKTLDGYVYGLDVSHWQGDIKWPKVVDAGYVFTFVKATESTLWTDSRFLENIQEGHAAGGKMGVYHFARPDHGTTGKEEAEYFLSVVGDYLESGYLRPVLDLEVGEEFSKQEISAWVLEWMETVENRTGIEPLIYMGVWRAEHYLTEEVTQYDRWVAYWTCEPEPSFDIPPTGKWADWAFWQYYGPSTCGYNGGVVPGVSASVDLNLFNGVESGLLEYDAASPLWVSLASDTRQATVPYLADITADVNGDAAGPINYHFWWNCPALEADLSSVEASCGDLPTPDPGSCAGNEHGMRCLGMGDETQVAEHTYEEIGEYVPKVIVERGDAQPAEDRYKVLTSNPIRRVKPDPASPTPATVGELLRMHVDIRINTSVSGALQANLVENDSGQILEEKCKTVGTDVSVIRRFYFYLNESAAGQKEYTIWARYRAGGSCPIEGEDPDDISQPYLVQWEDPDPALEIQRPEGTTIPHNGVDEVGEREIGNRVELQYAIPNPTTTKSFQVTEAVIENPVNGSDFSFTPSPPLEILPGDGQTFTLSFQVDAAGPFSFDLALNHEASNPTPYKITVQGEGVTAADPVESLSLNPGSPAEAWIGDSYPLRAEMGVNLPESGALQASVINKATGEIADRSCRTVSGGQAVESFDLSWTETTSGVKDYVVWARYRKGGSCPVEDSNAADLTKKYAVTWKEDPPSLDFKKADGTSLPAGSADDLGEVGFYETVDLTYTVHNPSLTSSLHVSAISAENLKNLTEVDITPAGSLDIGPGDEKTLSVSFLVENPGSFSFELQLAHDGSGTSPHTISVQGSGVMPVPVIQSLKVQPDSPGDVLIGETFPLRVELGVDVPVDGALEVDVVQVPSGEIRDSACRTVAAGLQGGEVYDLAWTESAPGETEYKVRAAYEAGSACPLQGTPDGETSQAYFVQWEEDTPVLDVQRPVDHALPPGSVDEIGEFEFYQALDLKYILHNPSTTSSMQVTAARVENLANLSNVDLASSGPWTLGPGEKIEVSVSFRVENRGPFSFDVRFDHDAGNTTPYLVTVKGTGVMSENPIQFITPDPLSPGSALIGDSFPLKAKVGVDVPERGALQVRVLDKATGEIEDGGCQEIEGGSPSTYSFNMNWTILIAGSKEYTIQARYKVLGDCPLGEGHDAERSRNYEVMGREIKPSLDLRDMDGAALKAGSNLQLGENPFGEGRKFKMVIHNPSPTTGLKIRSLATAKVANLEELEISPTGPFSVEPGGSREIAISTRSGDLGSYSFDLLMEHNGSNTSPYLVTVQGRSVLFDNPIQSLNPLPPAPGSAWMGETYTLQVEAVVEAPADSALLVRLIEKQTGEVQTGQCMEIEGQGRATGALGLSWTETSPGEKEYTIQARYKLSGNCPFGEGQDAVLEENYRVTWKEEAPELVIKRPLGVTVEDGGVDYIGVHDWFGFVEATYILENPSRTTPLQVHSIQPESLFHLKRVKVSPSGPFTIGPGEQKEVKVLFLVLTVDPYAFDLVVAHDGPGDGTYKFAVHGEGDLDPGEYVSDSKMQDYLARMVNRGFFLQVPNFVLEILEGYLNQSGAVE